MRQMWSKLALSLAIGGALGWLVVRGGLPLIPPRAAFHTLQPWAVPAYLASLLVLHGLRASRVRFLLAPARRLSLSAVLSLNFIGFLAIFALPLRLGEVVRPALGKLRHGIPASFGFGTVAVERVFDGLLTSVCVAFALLWLPRLAPSDPVAQHLPAYGYGALWLFGGALLALLAFLWQRSLALRLTRGLVRPFSPRLGELIATKIDGVADGLRSVGSARLGAGFVAESLAYWLVNALGVWLLGVGCGLPGFSFGHAVAVMGILAIGILLPTGPGLFGTFQLAVVSCLRLYYPETVIGREGAAFVFLLYTLQSAVMVGAGLVPLYVSRNDVSAALAAPLASNPRLPASPQGPSEVRDTV